MNHQFIKQVLLILGCTGLSCSIQSEVTLDGSVGPSGTLTGPDYQITENLGKRAGSNLFHSFGRFNLNASESATFSGSSGIKNVISRVTGGQASTIDGTLRVSIPNANLYLLNPAGVIFGQHAKLDVPGSFHVSTADYLKFQDSVRFDSGTAIAPSVLATAPPEAFGFLGENPADISLSGATDSMLEVQQGSTISLIGGNITSENTALYAPGGQINIASVDSAGEVSLNVSGIQTTSFEKMGDIQISQNPLIPPPSLGDGFVAGNIDTSGDNSSDTAGKIFIRGGQMVMDNALIASDSINGNGGSINIELTGDLNISTGEILSSAYGNGDAGNIAITANALELRGEAVIETSNFGKGRGGDLSIKANHLNMFDGGKIFNIVKTEASGKSGNLTIDAHTISLSGENTIISTEVFGNTDGGDMQISSDDMKVQNGAFIASSTFSNGSGGDLTIKADHLKMLDGGKILNIVETEASGEGGNLTIDANNISLSGENTIISTEVFGNNDGGDIQISTDDMKVQNGAVISSSNFSNGDGGDLTIKADHLKMLDGGQILNFVETEATGKGGNLTIDANNISLSGGNTIISSALVHGNKDSDGGDLLMTAKVLEVRDEALIFSSTLSKGKGGNLTIIADHLRMLDGGKIVNGVEPEASGMGGDMAIDANNISLSGKNTIISTEVFGSSNGGDLLITTDAMDVRDGALIATSTFGNGSGSNGNLAIEAKNITLSGELTGIENVAFENSTGKLGKVSVVADNLKIQNSAGINTHTLGIPDGGDITIAVDKIEMYSKADISASTQGAGNAGNITIKAKNIVLSGNETGISSEALPPEIKKSILGSAGDIAITVSRMNIRDGARISTSDLDISSNANIDKSGNIVISLKDILRLENRGIISTLTKKANAGNIAINNGDILQLRNSSITASVLGDKGAGGNITITTPIVALDNSEIIARAAEGKGGEISISGFLFQSPSSIVSASSELGIDGNIDLKPDTNISGSLAVLPDTFLNASQQMSGRCVARSGNNLSSFIVKGRGGVPPTPGNLAPSNFMDYLPTEGNSPANSLDYHLLNNHSLLYSRLGGNHQFTSENTDCNP